MSKVGTLKDSYSPKEEWTLSKPLDESRSDNDYEARINRLEAKLDALIAYAHSLEQSKEALKTQSNEWQQRYKESMRQQVKTRERLEQVVKHLKNLEMP